MKLNSDLQLIVYTIIGVFVLTIIYFISAAIRRRKDKK
jgi:hypothetical protein